MNRRDEYIQDIVRYISVWMVEALTFEVSTMRYAYRQTVCAAGLNSRLHAAGRNTHAGAFETDELW